MVMVMAQTTQTFQENAEMRYSTHDIILEYAQINHLQQIWFHNGCI